MGLKLKVRAVSVAFFAVQWTGGPLPPPQSGPPLQSPGSCPQAGAAVQASAARTNDRHLSESCAWVDDESSQGVCGTRHFSGYDDVRTGKFSRARRVVGSGRSRSWRAPSSESVIEIGCGLGAGVGAGAARPTALRIRGRPRARPSTATIPRRSRWARTDSPTPSNRRSRATRCRRRRSHWLTARPEAGPPPTAGRCLTAARPGRLAGSVR